MRKFLSIFLMLFYLISTKLYCASVVDVQNLDLNSNYTFIIHDSSYLISRATCSRSKEIEDTCIYVTISAFNAMFGPIQISGLLPLKTLTNDDGSFKQHNDQVNFNGKLYKLHIYPDVNLDVLLKKYRESGFCIIL